jgi:protease-4
MSRPNIVVRILKSIARWADRVRRLLHLLFLLFVLMLVLALLLPPRPVVPRSAALVLDPEGMIVDELSGDPLQRALALAQGFSFRESLLADLIDAVRSARDDDRIKALVLRPDGLAGSGLSKLRELAAEIARFRESGKPVYAVGSAFERDQYYLAAQADEIYMHPMGLVLIDGYSTYIPYYKSALEKLYVDYNTWTIGEYKSLYEPVTRDEMSAADREARAEYLDAMWALFQRDVEAARGLETDSLQRYADNFVPLLTQLGGDTGQLAVDYGLVDATLPFDEVDARIREVVDGADAERSGYTAIGHRDYLSAVRARRLPAPGSRRIAVLVAAGTILDGAQPSGTVGADTILPRIREAGEDDGVRALVLRIDSPGGSAFASEQIRRELELFRATGKPLVVSMGSVAASGGYWIALNADEIWASPATLTGSIGVGAAMPSFARTLERVGVNVDGLGTTELSGQLDPLQGIGEDISAYVQLSIEQTYEDFVMHIVEYRAQDPADVYAAAEGRVWIGGEALRLGLVDRLGNLEDAVGSAAELAGLAAGSYTIDRLAPKPGLADALALEFVRLASPAMPAMGLRPALPESLRRLLDAATEPLAFVERLNDPRGLYAYCFCDVD